MAGPTTEVLSPDIDKVRDAVHPLAVGLAELRAEVTILTKISANMLRVFGTLAISSIIGAVWWAAFTSSHVANIESKFVDVDRRFVDVDRRFAEVNGRIDKLDAKVDKLEARMESRFVEVNGRIDKLEAKMDARFDKLDAKLDRIGQAKPNP